MAPAFLLATAAAVELAVYDRKPLARQVPLTSFVEFVEVAILLVGFLMIVSWPFRHNPG